MLFCQSKYITKLNVSFFFQIKLCKNNDSGILAMLWKNPMVKWDGCRCVEPHSILLLNFYSKRT